MKQRTLFLIVTLPPVLFLFFCGVICELKYAVIPRYYLEAKVREYYESDFNKNISLDYEIESLEHKPADVPYVDTAQMNKRTNHMRRGYKFPEGYIALKPDTAGSKTLVASAYTFEKPNPPFVRAKFYTQMDPRILQNSSHTITLSKKDTKFNVGNFSRGQRFLIEVAIDNSGALYKPRIWKTLPPHPEDDSSEVSIDPIPLESFYNGKKINSKIKLLEKDN